MIGGVIFGRFFQLFAFHFSEISPEIGRAEQFPKFIGTISDFLPDGFEPSGFGQVRAACQKAAAGFEVQVVARPGVNV
jgi:hypothetical protein